MLILKWCACPLQQIVMLQEAEALYLLIEIATIIRKDAPNYDFDREAPPKIAYLLELLFPAKPS